MLKNITLIIFAVIAAVLIFAATRPNTFLVERSTNIQAPPDKVFALINDFQQWRRWSPWEKKDPAMKRSYNGTAGKGAVYTWDGNNDVGQGRMEILESTPPSKIKFQLDFFKPFEAHNTAEFTLEAQGDSTRVNWTMRGPLPFLGKVMHLFFNMDRIVGADFETGLANLKRLAE